MAKKLGKNEKVATVRDNLNTEIGTYFADKFGYEIDRIKEGILLTIDGQDVVIKVIQKKDEVQYDENDVLETYRPTDTEDTDESDDTEE